MDICAAVVSDVLRTFINLLLRRSLTVQSYFSGCAYLVPGVSSVFPSNRSVAAGFSFADDGDVYVFDY